MDEAEPANKTLRDSLMKTKPHLHNFRFNSYAAWKSGLFLKIFAWIKNTKWKNNDASHNCSLDAAQLGRYPETEKQNKEQQCYIGTEL